MSWLRDLFDINIKSMCFGFLISMLSTYVGNMLYDWQYEQPRTKLIIKIERPIIAHPTPPTPVGGALSF
jgi:hypothetical protein